MPSFVSVLSHWTNGVSDGLYCMIMTQLLYCVMVIIALILIFVTCINLWYHDLVVIIIWTWMYFVLSIDVPTQTWKFLVYTHWFSPPQGEQRQSFPPFFGLLVLASSFTVSTYPLSSSFVFNLTYGMENLSPLEPLLDKPPCLQCVLALSW